MSLRAFHILFIVLSALLAAGCAWWAFANGAALAFGFISAAVASGDLARANRISSSKLTACPQAAAVKANKKPRYRILR